jgi:hypothetical protein
MSLDLTLIPIEHDDPRFSYGHTMLCIDVGGFWHDALRGVTREPVPSNFNTFRSRSRGGESKYGNTQDTPYGEPLKCVRVEALLRAMSKHYTEPNSGTDRDRAALAYLSCLPPFSRVALFWH